jgi:hypothetical protein
VGPLGVNVLNPAHDWAVYHPAAPGELHPIGVIVETGPEPGSFTARLRAIAGDVDPSLMIQDPSPCRGSPRGWRRRSVSGWPR